MNNARYIQLKNLQIDIKYLLQSDAKFNRNEFKRRFHRYPNLSEPKTFSEKLLYLKQHYINPLQNLCSDKFTVNQYVELCGYADILKDTYQVCTRPEDIDLSKLPDKFFIQCSHTQGCNYVVEKKDIKKLEQIKKEYKHLLKRKHYKVLRENNYRGIVPRIVCSEYLQEDNKSELTDYKFYCFGGVPKYFMVSFGEYSHNVKNHKFDMQWNSIDHLFKENAAIAPDNVVPPQNFERMVEIASKLCAPFPHVRVDLYNLSGRIVFGEMTFYSSGGFVRVFSEQMDKEIGSWIELKKYDQYMLR